MTISAYRKISAGVLLALIVAYAMPARAEETPTFFADPASHCSVGTYHPELALTVHWSGACVAGKAEGQGVAEWQKAGSFLSRTEGQYRGGLREGRAITTSDGGRYEAEYRNGKMNGRCVMTTPEVRVDGQCANDFFNGPGIETLPNGNRYEGNFKDSKFNGQGIFSEKNGNRLEGEWSNNDLDGKGRGIYANGDRYEGDFVKGQREGTGIWHDHDGSVYEGEWAHNLPNGRGVLHSVHHGTFGSVPHDFAGTWVKGCFGDGDYTATFGTSRAACGFNDD